MMARDDSRCKIDDHNKRLEVIDAYETSLLLIRKASARDYLPQAVMILPDQKADFLNNANCQMTIFPVKSK